MILNTKLSHDAEYIGDVQENRVGIDKNNIDFITTLLTSNLYSKPLESFFRETVSNAYDSHKEAGTDEPILILIEDTNTYCTYRISIRDYGVGVTPERFDQIYRNIGSSTKRESNSYIGMFGIGRFSCLSCADVANINSYCNGKKYSYIMYKNGGGINIDKLSEVEGDFKNGLEVSIEVNLYGFTALSVSIQKLCLFDKLYIEYKGTNSRLKRDIEEFNNRKVKNYKNFSRCSEVISGRYFRVGNVIYDFPYDLRVSVANADAFVSMADQRYNAFQAARAYLIASGQMDVLENLPVNDIEFQHRVANRFRVSEPQVIDDVEVKELQTQRTPANERIKPVRTVSLSYSEYEHQDEDIKNEVQNELNDLQFNE